MLVVEAEASVRNFLQRAHLARGCRVDVASSAEEGAATCRVEVNTGELQQVLINLIVNAIQAMPDGGRLTLASRDWIEDEQAMGATIRVCDTGHGIAAEDLSRIFDPFFTTKIGSGTGLGLSISYAIIERYGGHIDVTSRPGEGACFTLHLRSEARYTDTPTAPGFPPAGSAPRRGEGPGMRFAAQRRRTTS